MNKTTTLAIFQVTETAIAPKTNKKLGFNILVTDEGKQKYYLKALLKEIKKYPFLKQQGFFSRTKTITEAGYLDVIVFGGSSNYDFTTTNLKEEIPMSFDSFDLNSEFSEIVSRLHKYVVKNYPEKVKKQTKNVDIEINIEIVSSPKKVEKKPKVELYRIHDTFVKVGYKSYDIYVDTLTGDEYIKLGGQKVFILEDRFGDKYLA
jgi:hypothetical protein